MKLVLLPGLDGTGFLFKSFIEALPNDIEILVISYPLDLKLSYGELVKFVISKLPKDDFILIGESFSGPIANQIALLAPGNLKSVIFVASFLNCPRQYLLGLTHFLPIKFIFALPIPNLIIKSFLFNRAANKQLIDLFRQAVRQVSPDVLVFRLKQIVKLSENYQSSELRASYIQATEDKLVSENCVDTFKEVFKEINVFKVKGPHFIMQTNPSACVDIIINEIRDILKASCP